MEKVKSLFKPNMNYSELSRFIDAFCFYVNGAKQEQDFYPKGKRINLFQEISQEFLPENSKLIHHIYSNILRLDKSS